MSFSRKNTKHLMVRSPSPVRKTVSMLDVLDRPELNRYPAVCETFRPLAGYHFHNPANLRDAKTHAEGVIHAGLNGLDTQVSLHLRELRDAFSFDRSEKAVSVGNHLGLPTKIFTSYDLEAHGDGEFRKPFLVESQKHDWGVVKVNEWQDEIPLNALRSLTKLRAEGFEFQQLGIAFPLANPKVREIFLRHMQDLGKKSATITGAVATTSLVRANALFAGLADFIIDPVLLGRFEKSRFWIEISRWL